MAGFSGASTKSRGGLSPCATSIIWRQIAAGAWPPVTLFIDAPSSLPTQTPQIQSGVKPTNQASRQFWLVPVLPAAGRPIAALAPVPWVITPSIIRTISPESAAS